MPECGFCGDGFENDRKLHLHWEEEHGEELNSHQEEKVKKTRRKEQEEEKLRLRKRKKIAGWGLAAVLGVAVIGLVGSQLLLQGNSKGPRKDLDLEGQPSMGSENASVKVVAFEDYQCPVCRRFETQVLPKLEENYIDTGKTEFYVVNFAFLGQDSTEAAIAAECVYNQDAEQFWNFHKSIFQNQGREHSGWVTTDFMMQLARENTEGLDYSQLRSCIEDRDTLPEVNSDRQIANSNGVSATPTVFVNGHQLQRWGYKNVKAAIESEIE